MSVSEYARHRGCSRSAVYAAIKQGKIKRNARGNIVSEQADAAWRNPKLEFGTRKPRGFSKPKFSGFRAAAGNDNSTAGSDDGHSLSSGAREASDRHDSERSERLPSIGNDDSDSELSVDLDDETLAMHPSIIEFYMQAKTRREKANAEIAELKAKVLQGEMLPIHEFRGRMEKRILSTKNRLLGVPSLLKTQMPHLTNQDLRAIDKVIRQTLLELSQARI